jgi:hypothetical protein
MYTKLVAARSFRKGEIITHLENIERNKERRWTSLQIGKNSHVELTDELVCSFKGYPLLFLSSFLEQLKSSKLNA